MIECDLTAFHAPTRTGGAAGAGPRRSYANPNVVEPGSTTYLCFVYLLQPAIGDV